MIWPDPPGPLMIVNPPGVSGPTVVGMPIGGELSRSSSTHVPVRAAKRASASGPVTGVARPLDAQAAVNATMPASARPPDPIPTNECDTLLFI